MSFLWDPSERPGYEVERLLREQLQLALDAQQSWDREKAVHETRKAGKRARAVLALARGGCSDSAWKGLKNGFRDAARAIGPVRDADVMRQLLEGLGSVGQAVLKRSTEVALPEDTEDRMKICQLRLHQTADRLHGVAFASLSREAVLENLRRSYRAARHGRKTVGDGDHHQMHEWRKAVKAFGYHLELMQTVWPDVLGPFYLQLDLLQGILGNHHDIAVLTEVLQRSGSYHGKLQEGLRSREKDLYEQALEQGAPLFAVRPGVIRDLVGDSWARYA